MIVDEVTLTFMQNVASMISERLGRIKDTNILKKPMIDFCRFAAQAKVGDDMKRFMPSFISAMNLAGLITTEEAEEKLKWMRGVGVYGAWEKRSVLELMRGKTVNVDMWVESVRNEPGDLAIPPHIFEELYAVAELSKLEPVGGVQ